MPHYLPPETRLLTPTGALSRRDDAEISPPPPRDARRVGSTEMRHVSLSAMIEGRLPISSGGEMPLRQGAAANTAS